MLEMDRRLIRERISRLKKRTGRCGAAQRIAPQSAESVGNESGSTGRIYVSRKNAVLKNALTNAGI